MFIVVNFYLHIGLFIYFRLDLLLKEIRFMLYWFRRWFGLFSGVGRLRRHNILLSVFWPWFRVILLVRLLFNSSTHEIIKLGSWRQRVVLSLYKCLNFILFACILIIIMNYIRAEHFISANIQDLFLVFPKILWVSQLVWGVQLVEVLLSRGGSLANSILMQIKFGVKFLVMSLNAIIVPPSVRFALIICIMGWLHRDRQILVLWCHLERVLTHLHVGLKLLRASWDPLRVEGLLQEIIEFIHFILLNQLLIIWLC